MCYARLKIFARILILCCLSISVKAQQLNREELIGRINDVIKEVHAHIGVGFMALDFNDSFTCNNEVHYPMQSVFKFPLAMAVLHRVDEGKLALTQSVHIPKAQLDPETWGPLVKAFPEQDIDITLENLIIYAVSHSDNNACDALFRLMGGTRPVNDYVHNLGVTDITILATEAEMHQTWAVQYTNWSKPTAMLQLLQLLFEGKVLSKSSNEFLLRAMTQSTNSDARIKGLLPKGTVVAHKTGTSGSRGKLVAATNDVGIITLPDGRHYGLAVFVSDYKGDVAKGEQAIAEISKLVWDYCTSK